MKHLNPHYKLGVFLTSFAIATSISQANSFFSELIFAQEVPTVDVLPESIRSTNILQLSQPVTVRVMKTDSAGSGVIVERVGNVYSVLTNWHVVESNNPLILTADDRQHQLINPPQPLGDDDLALLQFYSPQDYPQAQIATKTPQIGSTVYATGFPLAIGKNLNTLNLGNKAFRMTEGEISIIPTKSLPQGYRLGYTNDTQPGMSGSPIFNAQGFLVGIHGRGKYRDPGFGVYLFEDGSEPTPEQLQQMIESSWGIPIDVYSEFTQQ